MPDPRHSALDGFLRDYTDRREEELPKETTLPESRREALLKQVRQGIPRAQPRRRRTEYEDALEEKRVTRQSPRRGSESPGRSLLFGFVLRFLGAAAVLVIVAGIAFWWMDRSSYHAADRAGARGTQGATNSLAGSSDFFAPAAPAATLAPAPAAAAAAAGDANAPATSQGSSQPVEARTATPPADAAPAPAGVASEPAPAPATVKRSEYAQLATLAASVLQKENGTRVEFDQIPAPLQKRRNAISTKMPLMFKRVRIVQNKKGIEVVDRWDGSFYAAKLRTVTPVAATPAAREQSTALLGEGRKDETILRIEAEGTSFMVNKMVTVTLDLPLERIPPDSAHIVASGDANRAFEAWLRHCRVFGDAVVEDGERVVFEVVPTQE